MWWKPENFEKKRNYLEGRAALIRAVREWFDAQGFLEVETPALQVCPVMDVHILGIETPVRGVDREPEKTLYLHTSPEFAMKKLLVAGLPKIYQICHVYRDAEDSCLHSREFTMIEWYRAEAGYEEIMGDCEELVRSCARTLSVEVLRHRDMVCDPFQNWRWLSVCEAFDEYAGIDLAAFLEDTDGFRVRVREAGLHAADDDFWDDLFFRVMAEKIEPFLGVGVPVILYDYPVCMASLSRRKPDDPRFAERFELYICGLEIGNAFSELTNADEQRRRFAEEMDLKEQIYGDRYPVDEDFLAALEHGMPESGGIAVGIDRLAMVFSGAETIDEVLWTPAP